MDRIDAMRVFARVVERGSFVRAAEDLRLPASTATDAVKQLEARLGVRLLQRTTRQVRATLDGEAYYRRCLSILDDIEEAESAFRGASKVWADEVQAIIDAANFKRPVLVGWSYGGHVIADYLRIHGAAGLAGLNYVDAVTKSDPSFYGDGLKTQPLMSSEDLAINIAATRVFLRNCFEKQPSQDDFETMLAFNMMVPTKVRANMGGRTLSMDETLKALNLPVLVTHGATDKLALVAAARHTAATIPGAKLSVYDRVGHAPFWEDTARFNAELSAFVRAANKTN